MPKAVFCPRDGAAPARAHPGDPARSARGVAARRPSGASRPPARWRSTTSPRRATPVGVEERVMDGVTMRLTSPAKSVGRRVQVPRSAGPGGGGGRAEAGAGGQGGDAPPEESDRMARVCRVQSVVRALPGGPGVTDRKLQERGRVRTPAAAQPGEGRRASLPGAGHALRHGALPSTGSGTPSMPEHFVLKGGLMTLTWAGEHARVTRDIGPARSRSGLGGGRGGPNQRRTGRRGHRRRALRCRLR